MHSMRKKLGIFLGVLVLGIWPIAALAQYGLNEAADKIGYNRGQNIYSIISLVVGSALAFTGLIFFGMMVYAGVRWMTARGNEELAEKAKETLTNSALGFVIVSLSYALTRFVFDALSLPSLF